MLITLSCDRCDDVVEASETVNGLGAYRRFWDGKETGAADFMHGQEETLCWFCMWTDPIFLLFHPWLEDPITFELMSRINQL